MASNAFRLRVIANEYDALKDAISRVEFCYGVYQKFVEDRKPATPDMNATKAAEQLASAIRDLIRLNR